MLSRLQYFRDTEKISRDETGTMLDIEDNWTMLVTDTQVEIFN